MNPILGKISINPLSEILGTGMVSFESACGVSGLCQEICDGDEFILLAVDSKNPGTGQFRAFINQCKQNYKIIRVLEVWNGTLKETLLRYGFVEQKWTDVFGENLDSMVWKNP